LLAVEADFMAGFDLASDVYLRRGVVANEDDGKARTDAGCGHDFDFRGEFAADVVGDFYTVEDCGGHSGTERLVTGFG